MSKSKLSNYKYPGALASLSSSVKKVLDIDGRFIDASKVTWTQSVQGAVATWSNEGVKNVRKYRKLITDQVATAPCTDCVQEWFRTFEAKLHKGIQLVYASADFDRERRNDPPSTPSTGKLIFSPF